jgi:hypothetical protein
VHLASQADKVSATAAKALTLFALSTAIYKNNFDGVFGITAAGLTVRS